MVFRGDRKLTEIYLDGDFESGIGNCKYHCSPSCHPAQIGPDLVYGCTHKAWPANREGDFCPIVDCGGNIEKCEIKLPKISRLIGGKKRSIASREYKIRQLNEELEELIEFQKNIKMRRKLKL